MSENDTPEAQMKTYKLTCPVCRVEHEVQAGFLSSPRSLVSTQGNVLPAMSCGKHSPEELVAAR